MKKITLILCCLAVFSLSQCTGSRKSGTNTAPLRVGLMPAANSIPFLVAGNQGLFESEGINVELIRFTNPQERDAALQAGRLDATITDILATAFFVAGGFDFRITSFTDGRYGVIGSPQSGITGMAELRGKRVGLATNSIFQYIVETQLEAAGVPMTEYDLVAVPRLPLRMEMVLEGQIEAAGLPEPLLTAALAQGAPLIFSTDGTDFDTGIMLFSTKVLDTRLDDVRAFYRAYEKAAQLINANPDAYRDFLVEQGEFPAAVRDAYDFVSYRRPALPERSQVAHALDWLRSRGLLDGLAPEDLIDPRVFGEW